MERYEITLTCTVHASCPQEALFVALKGRKPFGTPCDEVPAFTASWARPGRIDRHPIVDYEDWAVARMKDEIYRMIQTDDERPVIQTLKDEVSLPAAVAHGRSIEAEMRDILESAVKPQGRIKLGSLLAEIGRKVKLTEEEFAIIESVRDKAPARAVNFE